MNDRKQRIDEFLKYLRDICEQNPNYELTDNNIYGLLTGLGIPIYENHKEIKQNFNKWVSQFKNDYRCNVFVSPNWRYFCQFISSDNIAKNSKEHLKVYVPLDSSHIEKGAIDLFKFLANEGISHLSKIGSHVRFDDIVIRLINTEDLEKLLNFISNNRYIQEGLLPANPFTFSKNGIAMAVDGYLSYNSTVTTLIRLYINDKNTKKLLNTINVDDFYAFIVRYYNNAFGSAHGLAKLEKDFNEGKKLCVDLMVNYKNVMELLLKSINDSFNLDDYIAHYNECRNYRIQEEKAAEIINNMRNHHNPVNNYKGYDRDLEERVISTIKEIIQVMTAKYGYSVAIDNLQNYISSGNPIFLTRDSMLRERISNSSFRTDTIEILRKRGVSLFDYLNFITNKDTNNKKHGRTLEERVISTIKEIIQVMTAKYGYSVAIDNLQNYISSGNPIFLTRDSMLRERISNSSFRTDIIEILEKRGVSLRDYLNIVLGIGGNDISKSFSENDSLGRKI